MSGETREILERLERGEINSQEAIHLMMGEESDSGRSSQDQPSNEVLDNARRFLRVDVHRLHDDKQQVRVKVPLRFVELGLSLGKKYAPELNDFNMNQLVDELYEMGEGTIVEVEDLDEDQHVLVWIEKV